VPQTTAKQRRGEKGGGKSGNKGKKAGSRRENFHCGKS